MKQIKVLVADSKYTSWEFLCNETNSEINLDDHPALKTLNPVDHKMFSRDVFTLENGAVNMIKSYIRTYPNIAGVLMLENNKTFGRTTNKKRLLYKCIPDDKRIPAFLVPYDVKIGFSKVHKNKFVIFKFDHWKEKHPHGILVETLGSVDDLDVFYEFQLYCKSLHVSLTDFTNKARNQLNKQSADEYVKQIFENAEFQIECRRHEYIFTIDPPTSSDFDDGYGIRRLENGDFCVSIYIANVYFWLETLGLWSSFSKRVATIYLPDRRRPMLPTILSDTLCSLQENQDRFALAMDFILDASGNLKSDIVYKNVLIRVKKNYCYEDPNMLNNDLSYINLFDVSKMMDKGIKNSHDVVAHWMVFMNTQTGEKLLSQRAGIFRSVNYINPILNRDINPSLDEDTIRIIQSWNNTVGQYVAFEENANTNHELLKMKSYIHITSPIRRLVDLLNQIVLFDRANLVKTISDEAKTFLETWIGELEYLNTSMRSIRKVQTDCALLDKCFNDPTILHREYSGVIFDKLARNDGTMNYMVYLKELKMLSRIGNTCVDMKNYSMGMFRIYLFEDEDKTKKKIRLQIITSEKID
jgi:exoribonuclease R